MPTEPHLIDRAEQPYVAIRKLVPMETLGQVADEPSLLFRRLTASGIEPVGAPFFKYNVIRMPHLMDVEVGIPVPVAMADDQLIRPRGRMTIRDRAPLLVRARSWSASCLAAGSRPSRTSGTRMDCSRP